VATVEHPLTKIPKCADETTRGQKPSERIKAQGQQEQIRAFEKILIDRRK